MNRRSIIVILSGHLCSGKSTLAESLVKLHGFRHFKSRDILLQVIPKSQVVGQNLRQSLIDYAAKLDEATGGKWIADYLNYDPKTPENIVVDCVRLKTQVDALRHRYDSCSSLYHIHLTCDDKTLSQRFDLKNENKSKKSEEAQADFLASMGHFIESRAQELEPVADLVISTHDHSSQEVYQEIIGRIPTISNI
jgi:adenylosuccinate synthase